MSEKIRQIIWEGIGGLKESGAGMFRQLKYDGSQYHLHLKYGVAYALTSRRISVKTNKYNEKWDHFKQWHNELLIYNPPKGETILVCEAVAEHLRYTKDSKFSWNKRANYVAGIMNSKASTLYERFDENPLRLVVFDILYWDGNYIADADYSVKHRLIESHFKVAGEYSGNIMPGGKTLVYGIANIKMSTDDSYQKAVDLGFEGIVGRALFGNKSSKYKRVETADVIITGFTKGNGRLADTFGAIEIGLVPFGYAGSPLNKNKVPKKFVVSLINVGQISGISDVQREVISSNRDKYIGKVIEVKYMNWTGKKLRHPRFIGIRNDKPIGRCTLNQFG